MLIDLLKAAFHRTKRKTNSRVTSAPFSVIVCSVDDLRFSALSATLARAFDEQPYELIRISDARSMCQGYNEGFRRSSHNRLIFCHDDIEILSEDFTQRLEAHFSRFDVFGLVGTTRLINGSWFTAGQPDIHGSVVQPDTQNAGACSLHRFSQNLSPVSHVQAVDGMFISATRDAVEHLHWDEANLPKLHLYDIDFSFRAHLAGLRVGIATDILIYHASLGKRDASWREGVAEFTRRYAAHLSRAPAGNSAYWTAACPDREAAYEYFHQQLEAQQLGQPVAPA